VFIGVVILIAALRVSFVVEKFLSARRSTASAVSS
jgi:hypothetical protein